MENHLNTNKIPTAEDFLKSKDYNLGGNCELADGLLTNNVIEDMIQFAKLHVEAALKEALENSETFMDGSSEFENFKNSILKAYSLENIK